MDVRVMEKYLVKHGNFGSEENNRIIKAQTKHYF